MSDAFRKAHEEDMRAVAKVVRQRISIMSVAERERRLRELLLQNSTEGFRGFADSVEMLTLQSGLSPEDVASRYVDMFETGEVDMSDKTP